MTASAMRQQRGRIYAIGIDEIDQQHGQLFDYLDALEAAIVRDDGWLTLHEILDKLAAWSLLHFAVEETLMRIMRFPHREAHAAAHRAFERDLERRRAKLLQQDLALDTVDWLRQWLTDHIGGPDRDYAEFFQGCFTPPAPGQNPA